LAIGDHYNDIDMLSYAGFGIAMDNAPDDVKKYAGAITSSNDEDGVAVALEKYVLI
jgi:hydroxymethylpyrimidine pyrophosphatase-like HAD family hydrolase